MERQYVDSSYTVNKVLIQKECDGEIKVRISGDGNAIFNQKDYNKFLNELSKFSKKEMAVYGLDTVVCNHNSDIIKVIEGSKALKEINKKINNRMTHVHKGTYFDKDFNRTNVVLSRLSKERLDFLVDMFGDDYFIDEENGNVLVSFNMGWVNE